MNRIAPTLLIKFIKPHGEILRWVQWRRVDLGVDSQKDEQI